MKISMDVKFKVLDNCINGLRDCDEIPFDFKLIHIMVFESIKLDLIKLSKISEIGGKTDD